MTYILSIIEIENYTQALVYPSHRRFARPAHDGPTKPRFIDNANLIYQNDAVFLHAGLRRSDWHVQNIGSPPAGACEGTNDRRPGRAICTIALNDQTRTSLCLLAAHDGIERNIPNVAAGG